MQQAKKNLCTEPCTVCAWFSATKKWDCMFPDLAINWLFGGQGWDICVQYSLSFLFLPYNVSDVIRHDGQLI